MVRSRISKAVQSYLSGGIQTDHKNAHFLLTEHSIPDTTELKTHTCEYILKMCLRPMRYCQEPPGHRTTQKICCQSPIRRQGIFKGHTICFSLPGDMELLVLIGMEKGAGSIVSRRTDIIFAS